MKLQFKHQDFQKEAAKAVVDVFEGQPYAKNSYLVDVGTTSNGMRLGDYGEKEQTRAMESLGWGNQKVIPDLTNIKILERLNEVQKRNRIAPSKQLEGEYNLTIEMETGVGKTYTYIKTMYELNKAYGWSKFIVVVPSIAIREGVYKTLQITQEHFAEDYGKKIRFFIYNSSKLTDINSFVADDNIHVMIINSQAFNARGKDARRIYMELDEFQSRRPIDVIAKANPIVIIDEPQSVEGKQTKARLKEFNPLMTLRYSATHKTDSIYNMVYRLDAMDAYNKKLVKKIAVKGITASGTSANEGYVYLEKINVSKAAPTATIQFDFKGANGIRKITRTVNEGYNLYDNSNLLEEYKAGFTVSRIDARDDSVEFINGTKLYVGDVIGRVTTEHLRRIQIRETILSHIEKERSLFRKGIKVLSLFFIDEVAKYKQYNDAGVASNGTYADMFEEEYNNIVKSLHLTEDEQDYQAYLDQIVSGQTHAGYFSIDRKGKMVDPSVSGKEKIADDVQAYDLIMKNKELLLDINPNKSPVRFIFSHSALREGWDNPNVFQICTLKQSDSNIKKRQEVGRGLRLCVNQKGDRMDEASLNKEVHTVNVLTIVASESYDSFAKALQTEIAETLTDRPKVISQEFFVDKVIKDVDGNEKVIDSDMALYLVLDLFSNGYITEHGTLTDKFFEDKKNNEFKIGKEVVDSKESIIEIIDSIYAPQQIELEDARSNNVELEIDRSKLDKAEFKKLWEQINIKSVYVVNFDSLELIEKSIESLDSKLNVPKLIFKVETGIMEKIDSKETLVTGSNFDKQNFNMYSQQSAAYSNIKYDLVGKLVEETGLTRKDIVKILKGIQVTTFEKFKDNPEEFIIRAANIINAEKATAIVEHITYDTLDESYDMSIFTDVRMKGRLDINAMKANKHLYSHVIYDSKNEKEFASDLDVSDQVAVYVKLPDSFYISTPVGKYNPDWAISFYEGTVKHIFFIAETKGSMETMELRDIEKSKIHCAKEHFKKISGNNVIYDVVDSYQSLLELIAK